MQRCASVLNGVPLGELIPSPTGPGGCCAARRRSPRACPRARRPPRARRRSPPLSSSSARAGVRTLGSLEQLVAAMLVHGNLVGDLHPIGPLELLHVEDLGVELGRVVDDDEDLGLGVEVRAGTVDQIVQLNAAWVSHSARRLAPDGGIAVIAAHRPLRAAIWRSISASTSSGGLPCRRGGGCARSRGPGSPRAFVVDHRAVSRRARPRYRARARPGGAARVAGLEHLADLLVALALEAAAGRPRPAGGSEQQVVLPVGLPGAAAEIRPGARRRSRHRRPRRRRSQTPTASPQCRTPHAWACRDAPETD